MFVCTKVPIQHVARNTQFFIWWQLYDGNRKIRNIRLLREKQIDQNKITELKNSLLYAFSFHLTLYVIFILITGYILYTIIIIIKIYYGNKSQISKLDKKNQKFKYVDEILFSKKQQSKKGEKDKNCTRKTVPGSTSLSQNP